MTPWADPRSAADGILDDETYDWLGVLDVVRRSGGRAVVAPEEAIVEAHELGVAAGFRVSPTGTAGLAGLLVPAGAPTPERDGGRRSSPACPARNRFCTAPMTAIWPLFAGESGSRPDR